MNQKEKAAAAAAAAEKAEAARKKAMADLQRHGQTGPVRR